MKYKTFKNWYISSENGRYVIIHRACNYLYKKQIYFSQWRKGEKYPGGYCRCGEEFPQEVLKNLRTLYLMRRI